MPVSLLIILLIQKVLIYLDPFLVMCSRVMYRYHKLSTFRISGDEVLKEKYLLQSILERDQY